MQRELDVRLRWIEIRRDKAIAKSSRLGADMNGQQALEDHRIRSKRA